MKRVTAPPGKEGAFRLEGPEAPSCPRPTGDDRQIRTDRVGRGRLLSRRLCPDESRVVRHRLQPSKIVAPPGLKCRATQELAGSTTAKFAGPGGGQGVFREWATFGKKDGVKLYYFSPESAQTPTRRSFSRLNKKSGTIAPMLGMDGTSPRPRRWPAATMSGSPVDKAKRALPSEGSVRSNPRDTSGCFLPTSAFPPATRFPMPISPN